MKKIRLTLTDDEVRTVLEALSTAKTEENNLLCPEYMKTCPEDFVATALHLGALNRLSEKLEKLLKS